MIVCAHCDYDGSMIAFQLVAMVISEYPGLATVKVMDARGFLENLD